jgi:hypothetical protein
MTEKPKLDQIKAKLNLLTEDAISLPQAARELPGKPDPSTLWRWTTRGVRGIRLETVRIGAGRIYTTRQALSRFVAATQETSVA